MNLDLYSKFDLKLNLFVRRECGEELSAGRDCEVERPRLVLCELEEIGVQLRLEGHVGRGLTVAGPVLRKAALCNKVAQINVVVCKVESGHFSLPAYYIKLTKVR